MGSGFKEELSELLKDPVLEDIRPDVTLGEVEQLIALERGHAFSITLCRPGLSSLRLICTSTTKVSELKRQVEVQANRENKDRGGRAINWRYIWRSNDLAAQQQNLESEGERISRKSFRLLPDTQTLGGLNLDPSSKKSPLILNFKAKIVHGKRKTTKN